MKHITRTSVLLLTLLILLVAVLSLCACNGGDDKSDNREQYCDELEAIIIENLNADWKVSMTSDEIAKMDTAGEYIVTCAWVDMICDVVEESSIQTAKIKAITDSLSSEDGKKLFTDLSESTDFLLDALNEIGLTSEDISTLIYDFMRKVIEDSDDMMESMVDDITIIKLNKNATKTAIDNLTLYLGNVNKSMTNFIPSDKEKTDMLDALSQAKNGIDDLVKFAYSVSLDSLTENILNLIETGEGALSDISNDEIKTVIDAIARNVSELKSTLDQSEIDKLNNALNLVIKKFDSTENYSLVFSQIVTYSKYAYMIVDAIPDICDIVNALTECVDDDFINKAKEYIDYINNYDTTTGNENVLIANTSIMLATIVSDLSSELGADKLNDIIDNLYTKSNTGDYQKAFPLFLADVIVNVPSVFENLYTGSEEIIVAHADILDNDKILDIMNVCLGLNLKLNMFKEAYYEDCLNRDTEFTESVEIAQDLAEYVTNLYSVEYQPAEWYKTYVEGVESYLNEISANNMDAVKSDLKEFVNDYFEEDSVIKSATESLAACEFATDSSDFNEYKNIAKNAGLYFYSYILVLLVFA